MLHAIDPEYARELEVGNYRYVMRRLEVMRDTGKSKRESHDTKTPRFSPLFLTPYTDSEQNRKELYARIDARVSEMFTDGLVEEVENLMKKYDAHSPGLATIGYREVVDYIE
jgi:tRNA dimethylallyltransferase